MGPEREWMSFMSDWAGSSSFTAMALAWRVRWTGILLIGVFASPAGARVYQTQQEALRSAFPVPAQVERKTLFLDEAQAGAVEKEAGSRLPGRIFPYYLGRVDGTLLGYAYFDTHLVRTLPETIMVLLAPDGKIRRIEILSFSEPEDYFPREAWLGQFSGKGLDPNLGLRRGIRNLTGASLTAEAITQACRRILALHRRVAGTGK